MQPEESYINQSGSRIQSRILEIKEADRAKRDAQVHHTERLFASQKTRSDAVLERLGLSLQPPNTRTLPQCPTYQPRRPESSQPGRRIRHVSEEMRSLEDDPFFEKKLLMGSKVAILHCKMAKVANKIRNPSPDYSLSSIDTHTPDELRIIPHLGPPIRRPSRLPVMKRKHSGEGMYI